MTRRIDVAVIGDFDESYAPHPLVTASLSAGHTTIDGRP
jgi:hypothetical protein